MIIAKKKPNKQTKIKTKTQTKTKIKTLKQIQIFNERTLTILV